MYIQEQDKERIIQASDTRLLEIIGSFTELKKKGSGYSGKCPFCDQGDSRSPKFSINPHKSIWKCFHCGSGGVGAVAFVEKAKDVAFPDALRWLASFCGIPIDEQPVEQKRKQDGPKSKPTRKASFCEIQLQESGLTIEDVMVTELDGQTVRQTPAFIRGTRDQSGRILEHEGDDMIIRYYDLKGRPVTYRREKSSVDIPFTRIRWQHPALHLDRDGNPHKYASPPGSGNHIYIPEKVRELYKHKRPLQRLFIQEGEKKAEKACKHGLISIGVSGIHNIATNRQLPHELQLIIKELEVKEVVFMVDSDYDNLSDTLSPEKDVKSRPYTFYCAVRNYRDYFRALFNDGVQLEIYFGHVQKNEQNNKGIDDLLNGVLKGNEDALKKEIEEIVNTRDATGRYVRLYRVSAMSDQALEKIWALDDIREFGQRHQDRLKDLPEFTFGRHKWRINSSGEIESAQPIESNEQYWDEIQRNGRGSGESRVDLQFNYYNCFNFLRNRGFYRTILMNNTIQLVRVQHGVIHAQEHWMIRDFVSEFTKAIGRVDVLNMLYRGGPQYLGPDKLSNLDIFVPEYESPSKGIQNIYFDRQCWTVTSEGIRQREIVNMEKHIWQDHRIMFGARVLEDPLVTFTRVTDQYLESLPEAQRKVMTRYHGRLFVDFSSAGRKCDFLQFLVNTSCFTWRKNKQGDFNSLSEDIQDEMFEDNEHLLAKLCAFGYLLHAYKDQTVTKAVIAVDGKQSEVGASNGRSGKSLFGKAVSQIRPQVYIPGKSRDLMNDTFLFTEVTEKTGSILFDDVRVNFDFEALFPLITGSFTVNVKAGGRYTLPFEKSPKVIVATNHMINGEGSSFSDRQWVIAFSDFYNDEHKPTDDFSVPFFSEEWSNEQWNLFYNLCALCLQLYFRHGVVESPNERIALRKLRQQMGETFLMWAEEYYSNELVINQRVARSEVTQNFLDKFPAEAKHFSAVLFKRRILSYCQYKGYRFNPHMFDAVSGLPLRYDKSGEGIVDDKQAGVEYFTVANKI